MDLGDSFENTTDTIFGFLPNLLGFLLILLIGFIVAKVVSGVIRKLLEKTNVDQKLHESSARKYVDAALPGASPSNGIARLVFWLIFIFFIVSAIGALGIPAATSFMNEVLAYLPNVIVAILIFIVAALVSGAVAGAVVRFMGDTPTGKVAATVVPAVIMVIAFFMILEQLQIAPEIVRIAFTAIMFALALGLALAFGLGGRELAADALRQAKEKGSDAAARAKQDAQVGQERARSEFDQGSTHSASGSTYPATGGTATTGGATHDPYATQQMPGHDPLR
jgi:MFS family permease